MKSRILVVDDNALSAENIRARLNTFADTVIAKTGVDLKQAQRDTWGAVVTAWSFAGLEGPALLHELQALKCPLFLYTQRADVVESGLWSDLGVVKAFSHLQRASLVIAVEEALEAADKPAGSALAPVFLLVEDSPTVRQFVKMVLNQAYPAAEIIEADDGRTALAAMKSSRISLIITDLQMPGMDGMSFIQLLQNNAVLRKKPVVVLSGAVSEEVRGSLSVLPKVQVLTKPATPHQLSDAVRLLLS